MGFRARSTFGVRTLGEQPLAPDERHQAPTEWRVPERPHKAQVVRRLRAICALVVALIWLAGGASTAQAGVFNLIPANQFEEPTESFRADDALFFYATSDIKGGRVCVVAAEGDVGSLSCDSPAWGGPNTVVGIGTVYLLLEPPFLRTGTWRLLAETIPTGEGEEPEPTAVSAPFTVAPCSADCDTTIASEIVTEFKAGTLANYEVYYDGCVAMALQSAFKDLNSKFNDAISGKLLLDALKEELKLDREFKWDFGSGSVSVFVGIPPVSVAFLSPEDVIRTGEKKAIEILKTLTCTLGAVYADLANDPPDPEYAVVEEPTTRPIVPLGNPSTDAYAQSADRELGLALALLTALERYQGARDAADEGAVHRQAAALARIGFELVAQSRTTARTLRGYASTLDGLGEFADPLFADSADQAATQALHDRIVDQGFTADERADLEALGFTETDIASIRGQFDIDLMRLTPGVTYHAGLREVADGIEPNLAAIDRLARAAEAVAAATNTPPLPAFSASPASPSDPLTIRFVDESTSPDLDPIESVEWDFGDGTQASGAPGGVVSHTYLAPGFYSVTQTVSDYLGSATTTKTVTVFATQNQRPVAVDDRVAVPKEQAFTVNVLANDSDPDGDALSLVESSNGAHGTVFCHPAGSCSYAPAAGYLGPDSFSYTISDGRGETATATVTVGVFEPPAPVGLVTISTDFNSPIGIDYHEPTNKVLVSANYPTGLPFNFEVISQDGSHAPFSSIAGLSDELKLATVRSGPCQGGFQAGELFAGTGLPGEIARVSPDGSSSARPWVSLPGEFGLLRGSLFQDRYCAFGGDLIAITTAGGVWRISSTGSASSLAQIDTHLEGLTTVPNDPDRYGPWAGKILAGAENQGRIYAIAPNGTVSSYELGIYPEDIDVVPARENFLGVDFGEGQVKGAAASAFADKVGDIVVAQETPGILWNVHWNPNLGAFEVSELARVPQWEHVTFAPAGINPLPPANRPPVATDSSATTTAGSPVDIALQASDPDGDALTYSVTEAPAHGTLGQLNGHIVTYTPSAGYSGPDSFTFAANDGTLDSNTATVTIQVEAENRAPVAQDVSVSLDQDTSREITLAGSDPDGDALGFEIVDGPAHGSLGTVAGDRVTYTPAAGYVGADTFTFKASDGTAVSNVATVTIEVRHVNHAPVARDGTAATDEDTPTQVTLTATDPDGDALGYAIVTGPVHGALGSVAADGTVTYTPAPDFHGSDGFTFRVDDGQANSEPATVSISVRPVNDAPTASDRSVTTDENTAAGLELPASDRDDDTLTYVVISGPGHGTLSGAAPQLTYTPDHDYVGSDSVTFRASDGALDSNVATVSITVLQVKHDTSTAYSGDRTVQYSDAVGLSARVLDVSADPDAPVAGRSIAFTLGTQSATAGPTGATGSASTSLTLTQKPDTVAAVRAAFAGDASYHASQDTQAFSITKEDCTLTYAGALSTPPLADTVLAADFGEPDTSLGERSGKHVIFIVTDSVGVQRTLTANTDANGRAQASLALLADVYTVAAEFAGDDYYRECMTAMDAVLTVETAQNKVTGGGWISIGTGRTNFGFNLVPQAGGKYTSQFQLVSTNNKSRFHGRGLATVSATSTSAVTWAGTGAWNKQPGYRYTITAVDNGTSGKKGDTVNITITSPTNTTVYTTNGPQTLKGGNLTVHR